LNPNIIADSLICGAHASITIQACCVAFNQVHAIIMCLKFGEHKPSNLQALYDLDASSQGQETCSWMHAEAVLL